MLKKILAVFLRDVKSNSRDFIALYIIFVPFLFAIIINLLVPSVNETSLNLVFVEGENQAQVEYLEDFAKVTLVSDEEALEERVLRRDDYLGIVNHDGEYIVVYQGNEYSYLVDYAKLLLIYEQEGVDITDSNSELHDFGNTTHPMKRIFINVMLNLLTVIAGMLIGINIVEEKADRTIRAMNVTPISRLGYIVGKSIIGVSLPLYGTFVLTYLTGFKGVNILQLLLITLLGSIIGILVGFFEGTKNTDTMEVAASVKGLFVPILASVLSIEFLADKWQWLFMWIPWYWLYRGNNAILSYESTWPQIGSYAVFILIPSVIVFVYLKSGIRKGLE